MIVQLNMVGRAAAMPKPMCQSRSYPLLTAAATATNPYTSARPGLADCP